MQFIWRVPDPLPRKISFDLSRSKKNNMQAKSNAGKRMAWKAKHFQHAGKKDQAAERFYTVDLPRFSATSKDDNQKHRFR